AAASPVPRRPARVFGGQPRSRTLPGRGNAVGEVLLEDGPHRPGGRGALGADRPVPAASADGGIGDAGELLFAPNGLDDGAQLLLDLIEFVPVGLERLRIVDHLGGEALVTHAQSEAAPRRRRREQPRLEARPRVVGHAIAFITTRLVVARVEQPVPDPYRVNP